MPEAAHGLLTTNGMWTKALTLETWIIDAQRGVVVALTVRAEGRERLAGTYAVEADRFHFETPSWKGGLWYDRDGTWVRAVFIRNGQTLTLDRDS